MNALEESLRCFGTIEADERICADDVVEAVEALLRTIRDRSVIRDGCVGETARSTFATNTINQLVMLKMTMKERNTGLLSDRLKGLETCSSPEAYRDELRERLKRNRRERDSLDFESERIVQMFATVERIIHAKNGADAEQSDRKRCWQSETVDFNTSTTSENVCKC